MRIGMMFNVGLLLLGLMMACVSAEVGEEKIRVLGGLSQSLAGEEDLGGLVEAVGERRLVLMGEASHGTREFYRWRAELSKRLIGEEGFDFIAVEGDWNAIAHLDRYVRHKEGAAGSAREALLAIDRWPLWMWANEEFEALGEWLHEFNRERGPGDRVGVHGVDIYGMWDSLERVVGFYEEELPGKVEEVIGHYGVLRRFAGDEGAYMRHLAMRGESAGIGIRRVAMKLEERYVGAGGEEREVLFDAWQHAKVVQYGEEHVQMRQVDGAESWNARARHFMRTVSRLIEFYGEGSRGIVWAHNTHIGDARATDMARFGQVNIGQLAREELGRENVFAIGFGTARGTVFAARQWEGVRETMEVPEPRPDSWEAMLVESGEGDRYLLWGDPAPEFLLESIPHRAIGVMFLPEQERQRNYVPTVLAERYDAFIFIPSSRALSPLHARE